MAIADYITAEEYRSERSIADSLDDASIARHLTRASRQVDDYCRRFFYTLDSSMRTFMRPLGDTLDVPDMASAPSAITDNGATLTATDYYLVPIDGRDSSGKYQPYTGIVRPSRSSWSAATSGLPAVTVTAVWGWVAVPDAVKEATLLIATDLLMSARNGSFGFIGFDAGVAVRARMNVTAADLLEPYRREPVIA